jgi:hypothetical protein
MPKKKAERQSGRGKEDAQKLWQQIPGVYREKAYFFTD